MRLYKVTMLLVLILAVSMCGCMGPSQEQVPAAPVPAVSTNSTGSGTWTFVVLGDSRDLTKNTTTGVSPYLSPLARAVAAEKPDLVMFPGDLVSGWIISADSPMAINYSGQFESWMEVVSPIHNYTTNSGVPLYVIRGNHEDGPNETVAPLLDAYLATVASGMPVTGPPGEERLTYSFMHKGAKFIAIDEYVAHNGLKETVNQSWVDEQLSKDTRPFMFVFGHTPAYVVDEDKEDKGYDLPVHPAQRDLFWKSLADHRVPAYFCGHAHLYVRGESQGVEQIISGNGGAIGPGFDPALADPALTIQYPLDTVSKKDPNVGYLVITVHENNSTFDGVQKVYTPKTRSWTTGDTFTINVR